MKRKTLFFILLIVAVAGFLGFMYYRDKIFSKEILRLEILGPDNAKMGEEIQYTIKYKNNGNFVLENPRLIFQLPENSLTEDNKIRLTKNLKDIYPGDQDSIQFKVRLLGKEGDVKISHAWLSYTPKKLSARYESETSFTTKIDKVPIILDFNLPEKADEGKEFTYVINYLSNIDYPLENISIKVDAVSGFTIKSASPTSLNNIEWKLPTLVKEKSGKIVIIGSFSANTPSSVAFTAHLGVWQDGIFIIIKDISQDVAIANSLQDIPLIVNQKQNSHMTISQMAYYAGDSNFENSGPVPPQVGKSTSYTITWKITNDLNDVKVVKVSATLPQNVTLSAVAPESQIPNIFLDVASRQIVWTVGSLAPGAGLSSLAPSVSFQITLTPDVLMRGMPANLIGEATVTGKDAVTLNTISDIAFGRDTTLPDDAVSSGGGIVK
ncbi:MAG: hypothetical protein EXS48_01520 [Candidatus Staskawiczbacteria bacterium]|nr:hypothetical protein [Candidatus Staskawiczbacteria bacterium]